MQLPENWQVRLIQLLAVGGMMVAFFLLLFHEGKLISVCSSGGWDDCGQVSGPTARYASFGPIPVALLGLVGYIAIFLAVWLEEWIEFVEIYLAEILIGLTGMAFLVSLGLTLLEVFVIHHICRYCVVSAVIVTIQFILAIVYLRAVNKANNEE